MAVQAKPYLTEDEYLAIEREAVCKSEYLDGEMFAMAGASPRHVAIVTNLVATLHAFLKGGPCRVFSTDLKLRIRSTGLFTYPDVMVACGELEFFDQDAETLLNPVLIVEVLSRTTRDYDRGDKFAGYRSIPSLRDYLLVDQDDPHVEYFSREPDSRWMLSETNDPGGSVRLRSIDFRLDLADVYYGLEGMEVRGVSGEPRS